MSPLFVLFITWNDFLHEAQDSNPFLCSFLIGFRGLGYEMVWTRTPAVGLDHEIVSVLAVVAAFFYGMAMGSGQSHEIF